MNVRLRKDFHWSSAIIYDDQFLINNYQARLDMISITSDARSQNIAYERIRYWVDQVLNGSVLLRDGDTAQDTWMNTGARVISLPEAPVDQVIGLMLHSKLNAVAEDRLMITDVEISSVLGEGMSYLHSNDENPGPFSDAGWWTDPRPVWTLVNRKGVTEKVITLGRLPEWSDHGLEWNDDSEEDRNNSVVFAKFDRDEEK